MGGVGVLILVHQNIAEPVLPLFQHIVMRLKQRDAMHQQIAEIDGVQFQQPALIGGVKPPAPAVKGPILALGQARGRQAAVLPGVDQMRKLARGPAFFVQIFGQDQLFHQPDLVVGVQNGEAGFQMQLAIASPFIGTLVRHMEQTFGFAVSAMANKAILSGVEYLSAYAAALGGEQ